MNARHVLILIISALLCAIPGYVWSQERAHFDHYTTKDGLSSTRIYSITQDSLGFIWTSTDYGLNRFDGIRFKQFQRAEYPVLARDEMLAVKAFGNGVLVGSSNGLLIQYDTDADDFQNKQPVEFDNSYYKEVRGFYLPKKGKKYAYTVGGIYLYDENEKSYVSDFEAFEALSNIHIRSMYVDEYDRFWIGTVDCLQIYDKHGRFIRQFDFHQKTRGFVTGIHRVNEHQVAVSTFSNEFWIFEMEKDKVDNPTVISTPFANVMVMLKDKRGRFWFATDGYGLWYAETLPKSYSDFKSILPYSASLTDMKKVYALSEDRDGGIWVGTQSSGLWRYRYNQRSNVIRSSNIGFPPMVCSSFSEDENGNIYVSTDGNGIYSLSPNLKNIEHLKFDKSNVLSMNKGKLGLIWLATWGDGGYSFNPLTRIFTKETFNGVKDPVNCIMNIIEMSDGEVWASTAGDGWYIRNQNGLWNKVQPTDERIKHPDVWAVYAKEGKNASKWFFSTRTLWLEQDRRYKSLLPDVITQKTYNPLIMVDAVCDEKGRFFVASNVGVLCFEPDGLSYEQLDFLPVGTYSSIKHTPDGQFWVSGSNGIIAFDYEKRTCRTVSMDYREKGRSYYYSRSSFLDSKGRLYFGASDGFIVLDFKSISASDSVKYFNFGDLYISRKRIRPFEDVLKDGSLAHIKKLKLSHSQSEMSVSLDIIDLSGNGDVECAYRLVGLHDNWIFLGNGRNINFSYIPPGSYVLEAKVYVPNSSMEDKVITLNIEVLPPWWASWWAKLVLLVLVIAMVFLFFRYRLRSLEKKQKYLEEKVDERTAELKRALGDKDRLISVIAHDLKNPMFAIVCALENMIKGRGKMAEDEREKMLGDVCGSAQTLQSEMLKLLDWAKSKRDDIVCHPTDTDVRFVVNNVLLLLRGMMDDKHISISRSFKVSHYAYVDSRMLSTVVRNLLSNAIKFTPVDGHISIKAWQVDNKIEIEVADDGVGMEKEQLMQVSSVGHCESTLGTEREKGTGLGFAICHDYMLRNNGSMEIFSEKGKGTKILLTIQTSSHIIEERQDRENKIDLVVDRELFDGNTILVVDDDSLICAGLKSMLEGYVNVLIASNGQEALDLTVKNLPDVILSDVEMPVMNGIEMSRKLAESNNTSHIPILFLSARNDEVDRLLGLQSGALDYISKPFSQSELLIKVANILKIRQKQQQHILADVMLDDRAAGVVSEEMNPFVKRMLNVIERLYSDCDLTMDTVAKELCVSQSTLLRRSRSVLGKTPIEVLVDFRLKKAYQLLQQSGVDVSVSDVAYEVGFNDPSYFTRKFRESFNQLPSQIGGRDGTSPLSE